MRYAFVFLSIVAVWLSAILLALYTVINGTILLSAVVGMTILLFIIGFHSAR